MRRPRMLSVVGLALMLVMAMSLVMACTQSTPAPAPATTSTAAPAPKTSAAPTTTAAAPKPTTTTTAAPKPTTTAAAPAQIITIRYSHTLAATNESPKHLFALKFQELCDQLFPGRVKLQEFPAAQLYSNADGIKAVQTGAMELAVADTTYMEPQEPRIGINRLAGVAKCPAHVQDFWNTYQDEFSKQYLIDKWNVAIKIMHPTDAVVWWFKKPYKTLADIKGVKTGQSPGEIARALSEAMGMSPVIVDMADRVTALQTGTITGCAATSFTTAYISTVHKYAPYVYPPSLSAWHGAHHIYYNWKWYQNLPADFRDKFISVIFPQAIDYAYQFQAGFSTRVLDSIQKEGGVLTDFVKADHDKVLNEIYPAVAAKFIPTFPKWEMDAWNKIADKYERGASFEIKK